MSARKLPPKRRPPASVADAAERLAAIVEAAEEAASTVIDNAEAQAQRHLEQANERADRIVAERLRAIADELDPPSSARSTPLLKSVESFREPDEPELEAELEDLAEEEPLAPTPRRAGSAGARLLATQMAVSGASREEIERRLQSGFDLEDTGEILDAILGPEGQ